MGRDDRGRTFEIGDLVNNTYRIEEVLGVGGTSEVYKARSEVTGRSFALKVLKSEFARSSDYLALMRREEEIRDVRHDAVVRYSENNRMPDGGVYLVMDYVEGVALDARMRERPLSAEETLVLAERVAGGLAAVHSRRIVHRDLSPDNIILKGGDPGQAVIIDFGIAKDTTEGAQTVVGDEFAGKYAYAAPEQLHGRADSRTDLYTLGVVLLAAFRGRPPEQGANFMRVVESKSALLDVSGVPGPLAGLIARLSAPEPADRFTSAEEALAAIRQARVGGGEAEMTIVAPRSGLRAAAMLEPKGRRRFPILLAGAAFAAVMALLGGLWAGGLLPFGGAGYPLAEPFTLTAEKRDGAVYVAGNAPGEAAKARLQELGAGELVLARGAISEGWTDAVAQLVGLLQPLEEYTLSIAGDVVQIDGLTEDRALRDRLVAAFEAGALPEPLAGQARIGLGPLFLAPAALDPILSAFADCGPLRQPARPDGDYGPDQTVAVAGMVAAPETEAALRRELADAVGDRPLALDVQVLNDAICKIRPLLPQAPAAGLEIRFGDGATGAENPSGVFDPGDNPTIDLVLPEESRSGNLWVSIVDVTGKVFHLLPNAKRPETDAAVLSDGRGWIRVAYTMEERAADPEKLAFDVTESSGTSLVLVMRGDRPLFDNLRPWEESVEGFEAALMERLKAGAVDLISLDHRFLETQT